MTNQTEAAIENQAELIKEEIEVAIHSLDSIKAKVADLTSKRRTFGKTMDEWHTELHVQIAYDADPARVKLYLSKLGHNLDTAYRNLRKVKSMFHNYRLSYAPALSGEIAGQANHKGRKVAPALDTMSHVASNVLGDRSIMVIEFESTIDFWTSMVWQIKDQIDIVRTMSMANGTMYKVGEFIPNE